jgi:hypothetical protein
LLIGGAGLVEGGAQLVIALVKGVPSLSLGTTMTVVTFSLLELLVAVVAGIVASLGALMIVVKEGSTLSDTMSVAFRWFLWRASLAWLGIAAVQVGLGFFYGFVLGATRADPFSIGFLVFGCVWAVIYAFAKAFVAARLLLRLPDHARGTRGSSEPFQSAQRHALFVNCLLIFLASALVAIGVLHAIGGYPSAVAGYRATMLSTTLEAFFAVLFAFVSEQRPGGRRNPALATVFD